MMNIQNVQTSIGYSTLGKDDYILFVGEGDFSYAASIARQTEARVLATSLHSPLQKLTERQKKNISLLLKLGGKVYTDVDATSLASHSQVSFHKYSIVVFNFPHIPGKMKINKNRDLLKRFFCSTKQVLADDGEVHVTLCKGQAGTEPKVWKRDWNNTWQITAMAAISDFILHCMLFFSPENYPEYKCSGYRGLEKGFHIDEAMIHVFRLGKPVTEDSFTALPVNEDFAEVVCESLSFIQKAFLNECVAYSRSIQNNFQHPINNSLISIIEEMQNIFMNPIIITFPELLSCCGKGHTENLVSNVASIATENTSYFSCPHLCIKKKYINEIYKKLDTNVNACIVRSNVCCLADFSFSDFPLNYNLLLLCNRKRDVINKIEYLLNAVLMRRCTSADSNECSVKPKTFLHTALAWNEMHIEDKSCVISKEHTTLTEKIATISVNYQVLRSESYDLYHDTCININTSNEKCNKSQPSLQIGTLHKVNLDHDHLLCLSINVGLLAMIKYHIFDKRILFSGLSYYENHIFENKFCTVYRSPSLFPPVYIHDISFWISDDFKELLLYMFLKCAFKDILLDLALIDSYCDAKTKKHSHCYRFVYQSCDRPLSKEKARAIHTETVRKTLAKHFDVILR